MSTWAAFWVTGRGRARKKSLRSQEYNTHIEGEGQFLWDYPSRKCCWHPHSARPTCGGTDHRGQRRRGSSEWHPPNRASWNGKPGVTDTTILCVKCAYLVTQFLIQTILVSHRQLLEGTFPQANKGKGEQNIDFSAVRQQKMQECELQFPLWSGCLVGNSGATSHTGVWLYFLHAAWGIPPRQCKGLEEQESRSESNEYHEL